MSAQDQTVRAFVALPIEDALRERVASAICGLRPQLPGARWVSTDAWHVTLRFFGDSSPLSLEKIKPSLAAAAEACPPSSAQVHGLGMFPERGSPRVLFVDMELTRPLLELQAVCERAARAAGFPREDRPFHSHLTLARWRDRVPRPSLPPAHLGTTRIDRVVLFRSDLRPQGAIYTALATFPLRGPGTEEVA